MQLIKKLRLKPEKPLWLINAPADCIDLFADYNLIMKTGKVKPADQLILFAFNSADLFHFLSASEDYITPQTLFWVFYPKKSGSFSSDLVLMKPWEQVFKMGFRGQTSVSVNDNWTGLRITNAPRQKPSICDRPMEERKVEGIDFANRTVKLPSDAQEAMNQYTGISNCFNALSFTDKKEYVIAITDAKKEETRIKRINKMIGDLQNKMHPSGSKTQKKQA